MINVYNNLNILFSTQMWPRPTTDLYMSISKLSRIHNNRVKNVSATMIQNAYIRHLYRPTHGWHIRKYRKDFPMV